MRGFQPWNDGTGDAWQIFIRRQLNRGCLWDCRNFLRWGVWLRNIGVGVGWNWMAPAGRRIEKEVDADCGCRYAGKHPES